MLLMDFMMVLCLLIKQKEHIQVGYVWFVQHFDSAVMLLV